MTSLRSASARVRKCAKCTRRQCTAVNADRQRPSLTCPTQRQLEQTTSAGGGFVHACRILSSDSLSPWGGPSWNWSSFDIGAGNRIEEWPRRISEPVNLSYRDEDRYPQRIGSSTKTLPHNGLGEVDSAAFAALVSVVQIQRPSNYVANPMGGTAKLKNPQVGLAFDLQRPDSHALELHQTTGISPKPVRSERTVQRVFRQSFDGTKVTV